MKHIKKIAIVGNAGSGKSTLAQKLHHILHLPVFHLDQYFWGPQWKYPDPDEYKKVHDLLCDQDEWIIDGMQLRLLEYRIQQCDIVIFLDISTVTCFWRIIKRAIIYYGRTTPSSAQGCPEEIFSWKFIKFLKWVWGFKAKYPPKIMELVNFYSGTKDIYIFRSSKEIENFVKQIRHDNLL